MSVPTTTTTIPWWRDAVIYQVYPRSFADADGDGIGDLPGVIGHLDDLVELGVDAVWLNPFYVSPQADAGYDVADHRRVDPLFGEQSDAVALLDAAHARGLRVLFDLVPNHTSDQHPWFRAALAAGPGSPERRRYLFRPGRGPDGVDPPNDWESVFGGPAWRRVPDGEWYLHLFAPEQPDLDWTDPQVREEFESILRYWFDLGVDGFRIDVAHGLAKDPAMPDLAGRYATAGLAQLGHPHWDQDEVHDVYRAWRRIGDSYAEPRVFVAEAYLTSPARLARYVRPDELQTAFNFRFLLAPWQATALREAIDTSLSSHEAVGATPTWVLSNHDVVRHVTRYGGGALGLRRARAALLLMLALPGSAYLYQGEELGLDEVEDLPDEVLADPTFLRSGGLERGRDGCRVPLPWSGDRPSFGFSPTDQSWLPQPQRWAELTRSAQLGVPGTTLELYRAALAVRSRTDELGADPAYPLHWLDAPAEVLAFRRGELWCVVNLGEEPTPVPAGPRTLVLASDGTSGGPAPSTVAPNHAVWLRS